MNKTVSSGPEAPMDTAQLQVRAELALSLHKQGRLVEARALYEELVPQLPGHHGILNLLGTAAYQLKDFDAALKAFDAAIAAAPGQAAYHASRAASLKALSRPIDAIGAYDQAIALVPGFHEAIHNRGSLHFDLGNTAAALRDYRAALALKPDYAFLPGQILFLRLALCEWEGIDAEMEKVRAAVMAGHPAAYSFSLLAVFDSPALLRQAAEIGGRIQYGQPSLPPTPLPVAHPGKIRLGYFSADFRDHPVSHLTAGLFEHHDRGRFEVIGFHFGPPTDDAMRQRLSRAFDRFIDVSHLSDVQAADLARETGIDIAIDLGGYTKGSRPGIFASRAAPVQVSYIGYLGTMGVPWMDYLVADHVLVPPTLREYYGEKIAWLPWYQVNDRPAEVAVQRMSRAELGLPASGVVFMCFNNQFKLNPAVFDSWMRILKAVPDSVLYLLVDNEEGRRRLRAEASTRGVDADRLVFAGRVPRPEYLARYQAADLFLDTWPCNAGTTASDALSMGLPVLTYEGESFAARIAASVLQALDMPGLITHSIDEYEQRAIALARDPARLSQLREQVAQQRRASPLYDTAGFTRNLEAAFTTMMERHRKGLPPQDFSVAS